MRTQSAQATHSASDVDRRPRRYVCRKQDHYWRLAVLPETNRKSSNVAPRVTAPPQKTAAAPQPFEWIPVQGDPTARRRARAHISRGIRRRKALEEPQAQPLEGAGENEGSTSSSSLGTRSETGQSSATSVEGSPPHHEVDARSAQTVIENLILKKTLGTGGGSRGDDPFQCFPVKLSRRDQAVLDHCKLAYVML